MSSIALAQNRSVQTIDTLNQKENGCDTSTFVIRTDFLDLFSTLIEKESTQFTLGVEYLLDKNYSIRLQTRIYKYEERFFKSFEYSFGPEIIKYFASNVNGSFYAGTFLNYYHFNRSKQDGNTTYERDISRINPGITSGYCYILADHFLIEPSLRIGNFNLPDSESPLEIQIELYTGYIF